jgi:RNA polymerase sigma-70 factor (ECF subfamily)
MNEASGGEASRDEPARQAADAVARHSYGRLLAFLAARTGDVAGAEDALSDAFAAALAEWPGRVVPDNPEAWLLTVARRRMMDRLRRQRTRDEAADHVRLFETGLRAASDPDEAIPDERLRLMFVCAHPAIDRAIRAPLILQTILGFDAAAIGSAFLVSPAAMAQRLVRAKAKIRQARIPFRIPDPHELRPRLDAVLDAIYAAYSAGWADAEGTDSRTRDLAGEGIWLGRLASSLLPEEPETFGLLALMLHAEARRGARRSGAGEYVPLAEQDPSLWNHGMIDEAELVLRRAAGFRVVGRYQLEAAVQSAHSIRRLSGVSDWPAIIRIYDALAGFTGSPVVAINRAVALAEMEGPRVGLAALDQVAAEPQLAAYQPYWAARADLLVRVGDRAAADQAYLRAIGLESDPAVRRFLQRRQSTSGILGAAEA